MIDFLWSYSFSILGVIIYFAFKAVHYIVTGKFQFSIWRAENLHKFLFSIFLVLLLVLLFQFSPASQQIMIKFVGVDMTFDGLSQGNIVPELLGAAVSAFVCKADKEVKKIKKVA